MVSAEFSEGISETLDILKHVDKIYTDKIPKKFKEFLEKNQLKNYIPNLDYSKKINEIHIKEETKDILAVIYMNYWCTSQEKSDYIKLLNENEKKYRAYLELEEKYNTDNLFRKTIRQDENIEGTVTNEVAIVKNNESLFKKICDKILNIFKR